MPCAVPSLSLVNTYKGLKHVLLQRDELRVIGLVNTYKGLKPTPDIVDATVPAMFGEYL
jgi:hypothetical protein